MQASGIATSALRLAHVRCVLAEVGLRVIVSLINRIVVRCVTQQATPSGLVACDTARATGELTDVFTQRYDEGAVVGGHKISTALECCASKGVAKGAVRVTVQVRVC